MDTKASKGAPQKKAADNRNDVNNNHNSSDDHHAKTSTLTGALPPMANAVSDIRHHVGGDRLVRDILHQHGIKR